MICRVWQPSQLRVFGHRSFLRKCMSNPWQIITAFQWNRLSMQTRRFGLGCQMKLEARCNPRLAKQRHLILPLRDCASIQRCYNIWRRCRALQVQGLNNLSAPFRPQRARALTRRTEKANKERGNAKRQARAFKCPTIVKFSLMESNCVNVVRLDGAQQR